MAKKRRTYQAVATAGKPASTTIVGKITRDQLLKMQRAAERKIRLESGIDLAAAGTGVHDGTKQQVRRRARRLVDADVRNAVDESTSTGE
jgi:hypothetical protein